MEGQVRFQDREWGKTLVPVMLSGEFDARVVGDLRETLESLLGSGRSVAVDLSAITFLGEECLWELVLYSEVYGDRLTLSDPSAQVELSVTACGLEGWIEFYAAEGSAYQASTSQTSGLETFCAVRSTERRAHGCYASGFQMWRGQLDGSRTQRAEDR